MKKKYLITGGHTLNGIIKVQGSKNASLPIIVASIMCKDKILLTNVPRIKDVYALLNILRYLNCEVTFIDNDLYINSSNLEYKDLLINPVKEFRASYYFIGAFLALFKKVKIYYPGGCKIGLRPIDQHLKGFYLLGATMLNEKDILSGTCSELKGAEIELDINSVGATINIILSAILANGKTIIKNAACEPEIVDFCNFLKKMGADIIGEGTNVIIINGVQKLIPCSYKIMPDRIVAGTFLIYGAAISNKLTLLEIKKSDLSALINALINIGVNMDIKDDSITVYKSNNLKGIVLSTGIYPLFPSDLQQILSILLLKVQGNSIIEEKLFEKRFLHLKELSKMGASYFVYNNKALLIDCPFKPATLECNDLRGGAALLLACLLANGNSTLKNIEYIERGYENIVNILNGLGGKIVEEEYEEA